MSLASTLINYSFEQDNIPAELFSANFALSPTNYLSPCSPFIGPLNCIEIDFDAFTGFTAPINLNPADYIGDTEDDSTLVGSISVTYTYTPIPEPASVLLLGGGLVAFAAIRRRLIVSAVAPHPRRRPAR